YERLATDLPEPASNRSSRLDLHIRLARLLARDHPTKAAEEFRRALTIDPDNSPVLNDLAWILVAGPEPGLRDPAQALRLATRAVAGAPKDAGIWNTLGVAHYRLG